MIRAIKRVFLRGRIDCVGVREQSSDYLENALSPQRQSAIQNHLSRCGPCRVFVNTLASTIGILSRFPQVSTPSGFKQSIVDRIRKEESPDRR